MVTDERTAFLTDDQRDLLRRLIDDCAIGTTLEAHHLGAIGVALAEIAARRRQVRRRAKDARK